MEHITLEKLGELLETMEPDEIRRTYGQQLAGQDAALDMLRQFENLDDDLQTLIAQTPDPPALKTVSRSHGWQKWAVPLAAMVVFGIVLKMGVGDRPELDTATDSVMTRQEAPASETFTVSTKEFEPNPSEPPAEAQLKSPPPVPFVDDEREAIAGSLDEGSTEEAEMVPLVERAPEPKNEDDVAPTPPKNMPRAKAPEIPNHTPVPQAIAHESLADRSRDVDDQDVQQEQKQVVGRMTAKPDSGFRAREMTPQAHRSWQQDFLHRWQNRAVDGSFFAPDAIISGAVPGGEAHYSIQDLVEYCPLSSYQWLEGGALYLEFDAHHCTPLRVSLRVELDDDGRCRFLQFIAE